MGNCGASVAWAPDSTLSFLTSSSFASELASSTEAVDRSQERYRLSPSGASGLRCSAVRLYFSSVQSGKALSEMKAAWGTVSRVQFRRISPRSVKWSFQKQQDEVAKELRCPLHEVSIGKALAMTPTVNHIEKDPSRKERDVYLVLHQE